MNGDEVKSSAGYCEKGAVGGKRKKGEGRKETGE